MRVLVLIDGNNGVAFHRLYTPYARLQIDGKMEVDVSTSPDEWGDLDYTQYDAVIANRWLNKLQYNIFPILERHNIPLILDIDDYWVLPKHNPAYKFYRAYLKQACKDAMKFASAVMVTTWQLAEKVSEINPNVFIIPNALDLEQTQWNKPKSERPFTIGWVGGISHVEDIKLLKGQIAPLCEANEWRFLMCGFHENSRDWFEMERAVTGKDRQNRPLWFDTRPGTSADKYGEYYSEIDLVLAPLTNQHFNRYKSELKILEAGAYELPIVCSHVEPYTNHDKNAGVTFAYSNDWVGTIQDFAIGSNTKGLYNKLYCNQHHNLTTINNDRIKVAESVCK